GNAGPSTQPDLLRRINQRHRVPVAGPEGGDIAVLVYPDKGSRASLNIYFRGAGGDLLALGDVLAQERRAVRRIAVAGVRVERARIVLRQPVPENRGHCVSVAVSVPGHAGPAGKIALVV